MNIHQNIRTVLFWTVSFAASCSNHPAGNSNKILADSSSAAIQPTDNLIADTSAAQKDEQTKIYSHAIAEYINAVYQKDKTELDTLFLGKHADFPNINLPASIANTRIMLLTTEEAEKREYFKTSVYINLFGWVRENKAEFIFVTFYPKFQHKYDCFIDYNYNTERKEFELEKLRFENYIFSSEGKLERIAIYKDGKYVGDKPLK